ncbi:DeoR/GlpR family DNA-binding transcription regulator [Paenibacillus sp. JX-17]|uniref:DeoR/GlpR family DNA-binding transcription regulator n=1 Tax=Paenibacillus lacisoli TaxID=3064525 RepID=A0ABT9CDG9_9BACL|nr:DeoR/GlpR family DNA-binding transcription regulator [Paenibacillus sp. JX-17]MDO7907276.1 DeoR/GlpR family DNA-binding transcription regulator [Paenibacillus sp. JX-17]
MYQEERMRSIVDYLQIHQRISIEDICSLFQVSRDTARRDLVKLEEHQAIIRTRGGALLPAAPYEVIQNYNERLLAVSEEKKRIGSLAAQLVRPGERVILDSSTTVQACAEMWRTADCYVITNSINQADVLSSKPDVSIHLLGGQLQKEHRYVYGSSVTDTLSRYQVDKAFIGTGGIADGGLFAVYEEEGRVKERMMEQASQVIVLADHSKFGKSNYYRFASWSRIDLLITDYLPEPQLLEQLQQHGVEVLAAHDLEKKEQDIE